MTYIDVRGNFNISGGHGFEESCLQERRESPGQLQHPSRINFPLLFLFRTFPEPFSPKSPYLQFTPSQPAVLPDLNAYKIPVPLSVIEGEVGVFNQETTVEGKRICLDLNITTFFEGGSDRERESESQLSLD